jgi:anti-anti-sigma factor
MKRHLGASREGRETGDEGSRWALASVPKRLHTLILTGELTHHSVHTLEAEIERCCAEGITGLTLDLRELDYIDPIGVAVIAFRARLCARRGYEFTLIQGPPRVHRLFEQAGVADSLPFSRELPGAANAEPRQTRPRRLRAVM